jgi:predicted lipase
LYIHSGFLAKSDRLLEDLTKVGLFKKDEEVSLHGHSLGGGMAAIVGMKLKKRGYNVKQVRKSILE